MDRTKVLVVCVYYVLLLALLHILWNDGRFIDTQSSDCGYCGLWILLYFQSLFRLLDLQTCKWISGTHFPIFFTAIFFLLLVAFQRDWVLNSLSILVKCGIGFSSVLTISYNSNSKKIFHYNLNSFIQSQFDIIFVCKSVLSSAKKAQLMNEYRSTHIRIMCLEQRMHQPMLCGSFDFVNNFKFWFFENFQNHKTSRFSLKKKFQKKKKNLWYSWKNQVFENFQWTGGFHERTSIEAAV